MNIPEEQRLQRVQILKHANESLTQCHSFLVITIQKGMQMHMDMHWPRWDMFNMCVCSLAETIKNLNDEDKQRAIEKVKEMLEWTNFYA